MLLRQGQRVPSGAILCEVGALSMGRREKLSLCLPIARLDDATLARMVWEEQRMFKWPGLAAKAKTIARELGVDIVNETKMNKKEHSD